MDLRLVVLFLSCALPIKSYLSGCTEIAGCGICRTTLEGDIEYQCPESNEPNFILQYHPNKVVNIVCNQGVGLETFPGQNLSELVNIERLIIIDCDISAGLSLAEFARRLGMRSVKELTLRKVKFEDTLSPRNFEDFAELQKLDLSDLGLPYLDERLLEGTPNLVFLNLRLNRVNISESFFSRVPNLKTIELAQNKITTIPPKAFENLKKLSLLNIWRNNLTRLDQFSFYNLTSLRFLDLTNNPLEEIGPGSFDPLKSLEVMQFNDVRLSSLPANLFEFNKELTTVRIYNNALNLTELPRALFSDLPRLSQVTISQFGLMSLPNDTFNGSTLIKEIDLSKNHLQDLPVELFNGLVNLQKLTIQFNKLETVPSRLFRDLGKLLVLDLTGNQITTIRNDQFIGLSSLQKLSMARNKIEVLELESMRPLAQLEYADFGHNKLNFNESQRLLILQSPFAPCRQLKDLVLSYNNITMIYDDWTNTMTQLKYLDLRHNSIPKLTDNDVQFLSSNLRVNLTNNQIRSIQFSVESLLIETQNMTTSNNVFIDISHNPIICDCNLYNFKRFVEDRLSSTAKNLVSFIMDPLICEASNDVTGLDVRYVKSENLVCNSVNTNTKKVCPDLCSCNFSPEKNALLVDCSNRGLTEAPYELFSFGADRSIHLNLTGNRLRKLPNKDQPYYSLVTELYASYNQIESVEKSNIIPTLKVLALDHNNLTILDGSTIDAITNSSVTRLTLDNNFWTCGCASRDFLIFTQKYYYLMPNESNVVCSMNDKPFFELTINEICADSNIIIIISVLLALVAITFAIIAVLYYRYQMEIKIWLYAHQCCLGLITEDDLDKDKPYDAFISYSHKDEHFVVNELVKKLESGPQPYKLCLHYRDWLAGDLIPSQIARSVEESKRTIIVLSKNFLSSVWGAMEFRAAHRQALVEGRARVIVVIYGDVPTDNELDAELKAYLNMNTYVQWGDKWFWDKLRYAMPHGPKIKGLKKIAPTKNNNDPSSPAKMIKSPSVGQSMLNMPTVSIVPSAPLNEKVDGSMPNGKPPMSGMEILLNGSIAREEMMHGIINQGLLKKEDKLSDDYHDTVNEEDDGGFNNRSMYGHIMFNFNNSHSTMV